MAGTICSTVTTAAPAESSVYTDVLRVGQNKEWHSYNYHYATPGGGPTSFAVAKVREVQSRGSTLRSHVVAYSVTTFRQYGAVLATVGPKFVIDTRGLPWDAVKDRPIAVTVNGWWERSISYKGAFTTNDFAINYLSISGESEFLWSASQLNTYGLQTKPIHQRITTVTGSDGIVRPLTLAMVSTYDPLSTGQHGGGITVHTLTTVANNDLMKLEAAQFVYVSSIGIQFL